VSPRPDAGQWQPVCRLDDLEPERGAAALVHGQAVAIFRIEETVYALANHDPFDRHAVLAKGIVGVRQGEVPFVASPVHKHGFDLRTGRCLDDAHVSVAAYDVKVVDGVVLIGSRKSAAA
jgi:nitrite reductase (NADH) small subunit